MSLTIDYSEGRFELGKNILILGPRNSGKTSLVLTNIFLKFQSKLNYLFVVSRDEKYKEITSFLFDENQLSSIFQQIQALNRFERKLLIIDEVLVHDNPIIECILINSHFFNVSVVVVSKIGNFSMVVRDCFDNVVIGSEKSVTLVRDIFEKYGSIYGDFSHFLSVIVGLGKDEFLSIPRGNNISLIRVNDHWIRFLYSYRMFVRYDILIKINGEKKSEKEELVNKVNKMMEELFELKKRLV